MNELDALYETIKDRKAHKEEGSYTTYLFEKGLEKILKKVGEECTEVVIASLIQTREDQINEIGDLLYELSINFNKLARIHLVRSINRKIIREEEFYTLDAEARYKALLANEKWLLRSIPLKDIASYIGITPQALSNIRKRI